MEFMSAKTKSEIKLILEKICSELKINYDELKIDYKYSNHYDCLVIKVDKDSKGIDELFKYFDNYKKLTIVL